MATKPVNFADLLALAQHYGQSADVIPPSMLGAMAVPEPASLTLLAIAPVLLRRREGGG